MGNARFSYDIHLSEEDIYVNGSSTPENFGWVVVDADGDRVPLYQAYNEGNTPSIGYRKVYCTLWRIAGGYELRNAGPPDKIRYSGDYTYRFDTNKKLRSIIDPQGNVQQLIYNGDGKLMSVLDVPSNKTINFEWTGNRITRVIENGGGASSQLFYDVSGKLTEIRTLGGDNTLLGKSVFTYDSAGRLSTLTEDDNATTRITFDYVSLGGIDYANVSDVLGSSGLTWGLSPGQGAFYRVAKRNEKGGVTYLDYDRNGDLIRKTMPPYRGATAPTVHTYTYDANRNMTSMSDGATTLIMQYSYNGKLTRVTDSAGGVWRFTYDWNRLTSVSDSVSTVLTQEFGDPALIMRPTAIRDGSGATWQIGYNGYGQVTAVQQPAGAPTGTTQVQYDENALSPSYGWANQVSNGAGDLTSFTSYSLLGDPMAINTTPDGGLTLTTTLLTYDGAHRRTRVQNADGTTFQSIYEGRELRRTIDEAGTENIYDWCNACGKLNDITGPLGWNLHWFRDGDYDVTRFRDARNNETLYSYGLAGELTTVTYPDGSTTNYFYDNYGRVRQVVNGRGKAVNLSYDAAGRLNGYSFSGTGQAAISSVYNLDGTLQRTTDGTGTTSYTYFANKLVQSVTYNYTGLANAQRLDYTYWPDQSLKSLTWSNGLAVVMAWSFGYDAAGRLNRVVNSFGETTQYLYDTESKLTAQLNANGTRTDYTFNQQRGWPTRIEHKSGGTPFARYDLTYDNGANTVGNLTGVTEQSGATISYVYDLLYRLTGEARTGALPYSRTWSYDLAGNPTHINGAAFASYDAANKITGIVGGSTQHDLDGNLTSLSLPGQTPQRFFWDDRDKMIKYTRGLTSLNYGYDAAGLRVWSQVGAGAKTFYIFSGEQLIGEITPSGPKAAYTWGADGLVSERLFSPAKSLWYAFGPQGETRQLTDASGAVVDTYTYNAYGAALSATDNNVNPYRYGGKWGYYFESTSSLMLCTYRWYSPSLTRWLSFDPIGFRGGDNLFQYVISAPTLMADHRGLFPNDIDEIIDLSLCPRTEDEIKKNPNFTKYHGISSVFHCGGSGYTKIMNSCGPMQAECFYDFDGNIVSGWCRGTRNRCDSQEERSCHIDEDVITGNGARGFIKSLGKIIGDILIPPAY